MPLYLAYADERRLQDEKHDPQGEGGSVNPQEEGPRNCGMEEVPIDSTTEARDDDGCDKQRHGELEVLIEQPVAAGRRHARDDECTLKR